MADHDPTILPEGLPVPIDDGAAAHLLGARIPPVELRSTNEQRVRLDRGCSERIVVYAYPRTGRPGEPPLVEDWDVLPGARGCTPEACSFRDHHAELTALGARIYGLSTQSTAYQQEVVDRLGLPFPLLSDADLRLTAVLRLPTLEAAGEALLRRLTLVVNDGIVEHLWYPVFPPDGHADEVLEWLRARTLAERGGGG